MSHSESLAAHTVELHDTIPSPIAFGGSGPQTAVRPLSTPSGFNTTRRTMPPDHGLGECVQPDRQVLIPARGSTGRVQFGQVL